MEPAWKLVLSNKALLPLLWRMFPGHPNLLPAFWSAAEASTHELNERHKDKAVYEGEYGWVAKPKYGREGVGVLYSFDFDSMHSFDGQVQTMLEAFDLTRHHYDPHAVAKLRENAQAARRLEAAEHLSHFTTCSVEAHARAHHSSDESHQVVRQQWVMDHGVQHMQHDVPFPPLGAAIFQEYFDTPSYSGRKCVVGGFMVYGQPAGLTFREDNMKTTNDSSNFVPHMLLDTQKVPQSVKVSSRDLAALGAGALDITGDYVRHGLHKGVPSYRHSKLGDVYLLYDGNAWTIQPDDHASEKLIARESGLLHATTFATTAKSLESVKACEIFVSNSGEFKKIDLAITPHSTSSLAPTVPQRTVSPEALLLREQLYGEEEKKKGYRRTGGYYNRFGSAVDWWRTGSTQAAAKGGAGHAAATGGAGHAVQQLQHHARHTTNTSTYSGDRRKTGSYARYAGCYASGGSAGSGGS
jgi:hypothetical protein